MDFSAGSSASSSNLPPLFSLPRVVFFLFAWGVLTTVVYAVHIRYGWHNNEPYPGAAPAKTTLPCLIFIWPAPGAACFWLVFTRWLWTTNLSILHKACFTVLSLAAAVPTVATLGFIWMLGHGVS